MSKMITCFQKTFHKQKAWVFYLKQFTIKTIWLILQDKKITEIKFRKVFKRKLNLTEPVTLNEKIQWLKLYNHQDFHTVLADKYAVRQWLAQRFGSNYLVELLYTTTDYRQVTPENIPNIPCIIKANNGSGSYYILRDKNTADWPFIQQACKQWLQTNYYYMSQEWQYKNIRPRIMVEKLLLTANGKIPNDYKLHFINGKLEFVYCSIDREGKNYRTIYNPDWIALNFMWTTPSKSNKHIPGPEIPKPASLPKMLEIGQEIAKLFPYVRVDFYDVDGKLYYGEITLYHGSGFDIFVPEKYDKYYGEKLILPNLLTKKR